METPNKKGGGRTMLKVRGQYITHAGLIMEVISETETRVKARVLDVYFPKHFPSGYQVPEDRWDDMREFFVGQEHEFWKSGTRANMEVGSDRAVENWNFEPEDDQVRVGTYHWDTRSSGQVHAMRNRCVVIGETEKSYKIKIIENWYEDSSPVKWVRKNKVKFN